MQSRSSICHGCKRVEILSEYRNRAMQAGIRERKRERNIHAYISTSSRDLTHFQEFSLGHD